MKIEWKCNLIKYAEQPIFSYNGIFTYKSNILTFYFYSYNHFVETIIDKNGNLISETQYDFRKTLNLPNHWLHVSLNSNNYILFDSESGFNINTKKIIYNLDSTLKAQYNQKFGNEYHLTDDTFSFEEYIISHKGDYGLICHMHNKKVWEFTCKGYLYTDISKHSNLLTFGTAGRGGHLYGIDIHTGSLIFDIDTKGTSKFFYNKGFFYFYYCNNNGKIMKMDCNGLIINELPLGGKVTHKCPLALIDDKIFSFSLNKYQNSNCPVISCYNI